MTEQTQRERGKTLRTLANAPRGSVDVFRDSMLSFLFLRELGPPPLP